MTRRKSTRNVYDTCHHGEIQLAVPFDVPPLSELKRSYEEMPGEILEREANGAHSI
jgi:hypothetical protein